MGKKVISSLFRKLTNVLQCDQMDRLISIENLIKEARERGVRFGKGDPYNRFRYYTKIGWLPHMIRKRDSKGDIKGHYPVWALNSLLQIEELKKLGLSNDDITTKIKVRNTLNKFTGTTIDTKIKKKILLYSAIILVLIVILVEIGVIPLNRYKKFDLSVLGNETTATQIVDTGSALLPKGRKELFVETFLIQPNSKVNITFKGDYSPATRYWVSKIEDQGGFALELDAPVAEDTSFSWWISN